MFLRFSTKCLEVPPQIGPFLFDCWPVTGQESGSLTIGIHVQVHSQTLEHVLVFPIGDMSVYEIFLSQVQYISHTLHGTNLFTLEQRKNTQSFLM